MTESVQRYADRINLLRALENAFSSSYLTLISIIQGGALGYLVTVVDRATEKGQRLPCTGFEGLAFALLAFLLIVGVWNEYMMGSTVFKWIPTLIDSLIPFAIGVAEISIILSIERGVRWGFFSTGALYSIAFLAFWNMYRRAATGPGNAFVLTVVREYRYITLAACVSLGIVFLLAGFFNWWMSPYGAFVMLLCTALMLVRAWDYWSLIIRHARNQEILNTADVIVPPKSHE